MTGSGRGQSTALVGVLARERVYLNAAAMGDVPIIRQSLDDDSKLNINCVDYMGRSFLSQ